MKKIVLIGDSIREGYDKYVRMAFDGIAKVGYVENDNCRFTPYIIRNISDWKSVYNWDDDTDLVLWNAGLWDDLTMIDGKPLVSPEEYALNVGRICDMIKILFPKAKIGFTTSTPVIEAGFEKMEVKRYNKDTERYNELAVDIVKRKGGIVNDVYTLMSNLPEEYHSDQTHFYTKEGTRAITNKVIECIEEALDIKANELDYDALFAQNNDAVGV